jgi:hypothetical protein
LEEVTPIDAEIVAASMQPNKYTLKWLLRKLKRVVRWFSWIKPFFAAIYKGYAAADLAIDKKGDELFLALKRRVLAISDGLIITWELFCVAFKWFIDRDLWEEIAESQILKQALGAGILFDIVLLTYCIQYIWWPLWVRGFFVYQGLRLIAFLGMTPAAEKPEEKPVAEKGAVRTVKSADEVQEDIDREREDNYDDDDYSIEQRYGARRWQDLYGEERS